MNAQSPSPSPRAPRRRAGLVYTWDAAGILGISVLLACGLGAGSGCSRPSSPEPAAVGSETTQVFRVQGVIKSVRPEERIAVIQHEAIPGYMDAMTMPFRVRDAAELKRVAPGDSVEFQFHVGAEESWMDQLTVRAGAAPRAKAEAESAPAAAAAVKPPDLSSGGRGHPLMSFPFTNQLGQAVSLSDFKGRALAITFIFTRCPVPEYCPRLTRNFQETADKLANIPGGPTNWHLISFTIDPAFDTPKVLKLYAERHKYDPAKWSFLTGPSEQVAALVRESGVTVEPGAGLFNHNFRTLIVGTNGQLQTSIPIGGPISDGIVEELLRAMGRTNVAAAVPASASIPASAPAPAGRP